MADWLSFAVKYGPAILSGAAMTLWLTLCGAALGVTFGILMAAGRLAWPRGFGWPVNVYVEVFRDTPFIVQLFFIYFGLPSIGIHFGALEAAVLALTLNLGAYATELVRAGFESLPAGQEEAAKALGLHRFIVFTRIMLPQAVAAVRPALLSQIVISMLDTAVVSQIALADLTFEADLVQTETFRAFETYVVVTLLYFCLSTLLRRTLGASTARLMRRVA
ncbi:MAG TPA: amino acid ABC transporter permease [Ancylobacter sp.]